MKHSISAVIPVYNSQGTLNLLTERLARVLKAHSSHAEIILVDDASVDGSWETIKQLAQEESLIQGIRLNCNSGQHNALLCGIQNASGEIIITLDDDLQNPPEEIPKLLNALLNGADVVYGIPKEQAHSFIRNFSSTFTKLIFKTLGQSNTAHITSAFRAFNGNLKDAFNDYRGNLVNVDSLLSWNTSNFTTTKVQQDKRLAGVSGYTYKKLILHALNLITGTSVVPLKIASFLGIISSIFGLVILGYVLYNYLLIGSSVPGFTFISATIAIFSGCQLLCLGIMGEYTARIFLSTSGRMPYHIRARVKHTSE